jgi:hypothetical protein
VSDVSELTPSSPQRPVPKVPPPAVTGPSYAVPDGGHSTWRTRVTVMAAVVALVASSAFLLLHHGTKTVSGKLSLDDSRYNGYDLDQACWGVDGYSDIAEGVQAVLSDVDPASGRGWAVLVEDGRIEGHLYFHMADDASFRAQALPE